MATFSPDCTVLVTSCDRYRDIDGPFICLWRRYWPDCPFETVLLTESEFPAEGEFGGSFDRVIAVGPGKTWSETVVEALGMISTPYIILQMNDFIPDAKVDTARMLALLEVAKRLDALEFRLIPKPSAKGPVVAAPEVPDAEVHSFPKNRAYSASCQTGYWNREFLMALARRTKSAWEFERYGSYMFDVGDQRPVLMTAAQEFPCIDTVHKGYWEPEGVELMKREGIGYDFSRRGLPPFWPRLKSNFKKAVFAVFPWELVVRVQNVFNLGMK